MSIRAVIFDFGGVLVRTEDPRGRRKWEGRLGLSPQGLLTAVFESEVANRATVGQASDGEVWTHVAATLDLNTEQLQEFQRDFWAGDCLDTALVQFIRNLRPRYKTAILSNAWLGARRVFTKIFGLGDVVDTLIISAEEGVAKPDARIYQIAAERLGVFLEEAVFVDDVAENVQAARKLGMCGVQFKNTAQVIAEAQKCLSA